MLTGPSLLIMSPVFPGEIALPILSTWDLGLFNTSVQLKSDSGPVALFEMMPVRLGTVVRTVRKKAVNRDVHTEESQVGKIERG